MDNKAQFVEQHLSPLLVAAEVGICDAKYHKNAFGYDEVVVVTFDSGTAVPCNVTWDSKIAIVRDVLKQLRDWL